MSKLSNKWVSFTSTCTSLHCSNSGDYIHVYTFIWSSAFPPPPPPPPFGINSLSMSPYFHRQGSSAPLVVKIADTEKDKNAKRLQSMVNNIGGLGSLNPIQAAAYYQVRRSVALSSLTAFDFISFTCHCSGRKFTFPCFCPSSFCF